ncbi:MAG: DHA2 family efflux MFS transporter permease subunit [Hyphomonadaceae bacterium]
MNATLIGVGRRWALIAIIALGAIGTMMAATIVNVALPSIIGAFGLGQDEAQWLSTAFLTSSTGFMLLNTWAIAALGMRLSFAIAMAVFIMGSVVGSIAHDLPTLVFGRVMQGAGAGLIQPMAMLLIFQLFPERSRGTAIGLYSLGVIVSPAFGPVIGGVLIDAFDWRVVFVATAPLAMIAIPLGLAFLPRRADLATRPKLDWPGLLLVISALALTLQGLAHGHREGWGDGGTALRLFGAAGCAVAFLAWEARHPFPVLNLKLFARPAFCLAALAIFATGVAVYGSTYLVPLFVQLVQHYSPAGAGGILLPAGVAMAASFPLSGRLSDRIDARILLGAGVMMFAASMWLLADVAVFSSFEAMAFAVALSRTGIATVMPAANASAMRQVHDMLAFAAPAATFFTQTGGALGVAMLSVLLQERAAFHADAMQPLVNESNGAAVEALALLRQGLEAGGVAPSQSATMAGQQMAASIWASAQLLAFRDCFAAVAAAFLLLLPLTVLIPGRKARKTRPISAPIDRISSIS